MGIIDILGPVLNPIIERVFPDPKDRYDFQVKMATLADQENQRAHDEMMGQIGTNTAEANRGNMFVAGWRPFIGWTGGIGIAYSCVLEPMMNWVSTVLFHYNGTFPTLQTDQLYALVTGMLGFGTMRAVEKIQGVPNSQPTFASPAASTVTPIALPVPKKKILGIPWPF